ncbi:MAG: metallophosphoesterase [Candidatus Methanomethylophilaceae archaeon]|jgi:putative SbcD/Mre11-related phosphoesterase
MRTLEILPDVLVTSDRCLLLEGGRTAVIGDLHLGYETSLEDEGMFLPRVNTGTIRDALNRIISRYEPERMVLLGDVKHDFRRSRGESSDEILRVIRLLNEAVETLVIKGNHDNYIQNVLIEEGMSAVDFADIAGFRLEHGHVDSGRRPVIIGHEHPAVRIPGSGGEKIHCFVLAREEGVLVIPPFSPMSLGSDLLTEGTAMSPALRESDVGKAEIYGVSDLGIMDLGTLSELEDMDAY